MRRWSSRLDPALLMLLIGPMMIFFAWGVTYSQLAKDRSRALIEGYREANGLSRSFAEQTLHRIDDIDQMLRVVRAAYLARGKDIDIDRLLRDAGFPEQRSIEVAILDAANRLAVGEASGSPEWLPATIPGGTVVDRTVVSTPLPARAGRPDALIVSRPILRPDGSFAGAVVAKVRPEQILSRLRRLNVGPMARQFGAVELGRDDIAAILGLDGRPRAALHGAVQVPAARLPSYQVFRRLNDGTVEKVPVPLVDVVPRLWSGGYLGDYRLIIVVGISRKDALVDYELHRRIYLIGSVAFTVGVGLLTILAAVLARRQKRTLQRLARSERQANELKSTFLAKISHDLRTPLNGILGFSELVKTTASEPEQRQYGEYIHDSSSHLLDLVNMILDLAKLRNGTLQLRLGDVDLRQVAQSVSRIHAIVAKQKGLGFRLDVAAGFPERVTCDGVRIREVLHNLLHNAVKFTRAGHVAVDLFLRDGQACVRVSDTGIGMTDEIKSRLFQPFSEGRDEASRALAGAGLGLAFSRELVALHGGAIEIESQEGAGTSVTFSIPVTGPGTARASAPVHASNEGSGHATRTDRR
ncbi:ATP-binding protein [Lysobacter sp. GCM10012299]|uniref:sensor histidine kinase n=1 Tax=Lysobacter sp. GCM10012299 TaxID=3317333 RepID=UPI00360C0068